ncbi:MAG: hypothetical protein IPK60_11535 [Sandaracinaceae bacterium]|nr:hypothetical protein [Sandaracinaceae bacterium]
MMRHAFLALTVLALSAVGAAHARADSIVVALPVHRIAEFRAALRLEVDRATELSVVEVPSARTIDARAFASEEATRIHATRIVWLEFQSGDLRPPTVFVDTADGHAPQSLLLQSAYDIVEPRVFALSVASLLEAPATPATPSVAPQPNAATVPPLEPTAESPNATPTPPPVVAPPTRRRVRSSRFDRPVLAIRLGSQLGALRLGRPFALEFAPVHFGMNFYFPSWRLDADVILSGRGQRMAVGASYFFAPPSSPLTTLLGGRGLFGTDHEPDRATENSHFLLGVGAFFAAREHITDHWAVEERLGADFIGRFADRLGNDAAAGVLLYGSLTLEYIF